MNIPSQELFPRDMTWTSYCPRAIELLKGLKSGELTIHWSSAKDKWQRANWGSGKHMQITGPKEKPSRVVFFHQLTIVK